MTLTCGMAGYRRRSFAAATACSGVIWATCAFLTGRAGGSTFEDRPWMGLVLALGPAPVLSILAEALRQIRRWRVLMRVRSQPAGGSHEPVTPHSSGPASASPPSLAEALPGTRPVDHVSALRVISSAMPSRAATGAVPCLRGARQRGLRDGLRTLLAGAETACREPGERLVNVGEGATGGHRPPHEHAQPALIMARCAARAHDAGVNSCRGVMEGQRQRDDLP